MRGFLDDLSGKVHHMGLSPHLQLNENAPNRAITQKMTHRFTSLSGIHYRSKTPTNPEISDKIYSKIQISTGLLIKITTGLGSFAPVTGAHSMKITPNFG